MLKKKSKMLVHLVEACEQEINVWEV